ncbi:unnamed protein product, partial [Mesorhabditis spiculigera]
MVKVRLVVPAEMMGQINGLCSEARGERGEISSIDEERLLITWRLPMAGVVIDFFDNLKRITSGYVSFDYDFDGMVESTGPVAVPVVDEKERALNQYRKKLTDYKEIEQRLKELRKKEQELQKLHDKSENDIKSLQSVGQIVGEVLKQLSEEKFIVKATNGPRYVVGCRRSINKVALKQGTRVALDMTTLTIMRQLPREVDPLVYKMSHEDPGNITYGDVGGLAEQIRELREVVELPLLNPELFRRVGITPPKGCLLYGPPGTGKTLLARAVASQLDCNFLKVVSSAIVDKYIGESARMIREMFNYARDHQPCIVFMDEIDAIGGRRFSEGTSADREIQRTLMELLNQLDGFDSLGQVKVIMATNRPDTLDPALLRPGRLDRKIEIALPNEQARLEVIKIHANPITKHGDIDFEAVVKLSDGFSCADLRNVCTEAGLFAIRAEREYVVEEDFMKAVRKSEKWIGCYLFPASQCFCLFYVLAAAVFKLHGFFAALIIGLVSVDLIFWFVNTLSIFQCAVSFGDTLPQWGSPLNLLAKILLWRGFSIIVELGILGALVIVQTTKDITVTFSMIAIGLSIVLFGGLGTWLLYSFRNRLLEEPVAQDTPRIRDQTPISQDTPIQSAGPTIAYPPTERSAGSQSSRISSQTPKHKIAAPPNWRQMQKIVEGDGPLEPREVVAGISWLTPARLLPDDKPSCAPVDPVPVPEDQPDYRYRAEQGVPTTSEQPVQPENLEYANNRF